MKHGIFYTPLGADFAKVFADGLCDFLDQFPLKDQIEAEVYFNAEQTRQSVMRAMHHSASRIWPKFRLISDVVRNLEIPLPKERSSLERIITLSELIKVYADQTGALASSQARFALAQTLDQQLSEMQREKARLDDITRLIPDDLARHWEFSAKFLRIAQEVMSPDLRVDPNSRLRFAIERQAELWLSRNPQHPIIIAGSTGSRGDIRVLMKAVLQLTHGAIVFPGMEEDMPDDIWDGFLAEEFSFDHPQAAILKSVAALDARREDLKPWSLTASAGERAEFTRIALTPPPATDHWHREKENFSQKIDVQTKDLTLIEVETQKEEAEAIASVLQEAEALGKSSALITPDRLLRRRVTAILNTRSIDVDESAGQPLSQTPPGLYLRAIAQNFGAEADILSTISLLKHPFTMNKDRITHLRWLRSLERACLRGSGRYFRHAILADWYDDADQLGRDWLDWIFEGLLIGAKDTATLQEWTDLHLKKALHFLGEAASAEGPELWKGEAGEKAKSVFQALQDIEIADVHMTYRDYNAFFLVTLSGINRALARPSNSKISIWGTREARAATAEVTVLASLNEGSWPEKIGDNPWLNRLMRASIGLPAPELSVGLSAHDFSQAFADGIVVLTRAARTSGEQTLPSRYLLRLTQLMEGLGERGKTALSDMRARGRFWTAGQGASRASDRQEEKAKRPAPAPPLHARPKRISVTEVETLIRDPYAFYAARVLKLFALPVLGASDDARLRGTVLHKILEDFVRNAHPLEPRYLKALAGEYFDRFAPDPLAAFLWSDALIKRASWFLEGEALRQGQSSTPLLEEKAVMTFGDGSFELSAKPDRIYFDATGRAYLFDYKTGKPPTPAQVAHFAKQLPLTAAMIGNGVFGGGKKTVEVAEIAYLGFDGTHQALDMSVGEIDEVFIQFAEFFLAFQDPQVGYIARTRPHLLVFESDYLHLSRFGEWADGDSVEVALL